MNITRSDTEEKPARLVGGVSDTVQMFDGRRSVGRPAAPGPPKGTDDVHDKIFSVKIIIIREMYCNTFSGTKHRTRRDNHLRVGDRNHRGPTAYYYCNLSAGRPTDVSLGVSDNRKKNKKNCLYKMGFRRVRYVCVPNITLCSLSTGGIVKFSPTTRCGSSDIIV